MTHIKDLVFWSCDPGDSHVGLARWRGTECLEAVETTPVGVVDLLHAALDTPGQPRLLVLEAFNLRGSLMAEQQGSEFLTSQLIGALRHTCRRADIPVAMQTPWQAKQLQQLAPWRDWPVRAFTSYGHGRHAKDAELHGIKYLRSWMAKNDVPALGDWMADQARRTRPVGSVNRAKTGT